MLSSSEIQRVALSARNSLQIKCSIPALHKSGATSQTPPRPTVSNDSVGGGGGSASSSPEKGQASGQLGDGTNGSPSLPPKGVASRDESKLMNKSHGSSSSEINNSTIISVEPETSFGDMTMDSIKDHLVFVYYIPLCLFTS